MIKDGIDYEVMGAEIAERKAEALRNEDLRDRFALAALTGLIAALAQPDSVGPDNFNSEILAVDAWEIADAMMTAREGTPVLARPVPIQPSDAMIEAGEEEIASRRAHGCRVYASDIWNTMAAAAPEKGDGNEAL